MSFSPPPSWRSGSNSQVLLSNGRGGYQVACPGANQPNGIPRNASQNAPHPATEPAAGKSAQPRQIPNASTASYHAAAPSGETAHGNANSDADSAATEYISQKICKIHGRNKVIDFNSKLTKAKLTDFANIHGCGGSNHAPNSTIGLTLCDFTNGTGDKSVTVKYAVDVEDMTLLYEAAKAARLGTLQPGSAAQTDWIGTAERLLSSWTAIPPMQNGSRPIPSNDLNALDAAVRSAREAEKNIGNTPLFSYCREKNNPYMIDGNGYGPVSKIVVSYSPYRKDGKPSDYPWYIGIENYQAPITKKAGGTTTHNGAKAVNKRTAFINLRTDDFLAAMTAVDRFVRLWEQVNMGPVMADAYRQIEAAREQASE